MGLYCKAESPPQQIQDLMCGAIEQNHGWCTNPSQLMKCIPELVPIANRALQPSSEEGAFKLAEEADKLMHEADWNELFNLSKALADGETAAAPSGSSAPP